MAAVWGHFSIEGPLWNLNGISPFMWGEYASQGNPYGRSAPLHNTQYINRNRLVGTELYYPPCQPDYKSKQYENQLHANTTQNTMKTLKKQKELLELKLARKLITETRDTLTAIAKNEDKHKKNDTMLPFPIEEIQVHLLDEDGEGMVLWLQGSIEKGKILIEKGFEELTDHEETIQVELESDEEEDHMIEEMFTTVNKKPVLLN